MSNVAQLRPMVDVPTALRNIADAYEAGNYGMLCERIRAGWDAERAVTTPKRKGGL